RLRAQDNAGVQAEVIYQSMGLNLYNLPDVDYQPACFQSYNRSIAEVCAGPPNRLVGIGQTAMRTPAEGIADLEEIKALGLRGVMLPRIPPTAAYADAGDA